MSAASDRCTSCHSLDTPAKIAEHHRNLAVNESDVVQIPSIVVAGATINGCASCHDGLLPDDFHETRWATPPTSMGIDWGKIIEQNRWTWPREICERMVSNLPSAAERAEHFHEDARLFWAVQSGLTPMGYTLPRAHPEVYSMCVKHFDSWNDSGARCPQ